MGFGGTIYEVSSPFATHIWFIIDVFPAPDKPNRSTGFSWLSSIYKSKCNENCYWDFFQQININKQIDITKSTLDRSKMVSNQNSNLRHFFKTFVYCQKFSFFPISICDVCTNACTSDPKDLLTVLKYISYHYSRILLFNERLKSSADFLGLNFACWHVILWIVTLPHDIYLSSFKWVGR